MTPFWQDDHLTLYGGDCREVLRELPAESVHCVVTSPPYWGLRDYGTASWDGGDEGCDHSTPRSRGDDIRPGDKQGTSAGSRPNTVTVCRKCGARRIDSQLGLEATPEAFVANMVDVFREVRRVLRKDGTLWLNLGDSYANPPPSGTAGQWNVKKDTGRGHTTEAIEGQRLIGGTLKASGLKQKDLCGIPWRVAFALQADGWYLRSDIIWSKPNPMPESVTDRPTKAHEYLFLLTRSPRYYYDAEAVREAFTDDRMGNPGGGSRNYAPGDRNDGTDSRMLTWDKGAERGGRNLRSVWNIATEPYPGAHFATFPRKLVEPCVKAGTSERGVCPECGAPWVRVVEVREDYREWAKTQRFYGEGGNGSAFRGAGTNSAIAPQRNETTGWRASCTHEAEPVPAVVLDPFAGSGTTLLVAQALGRRGVGIDLSPDYLRQALERNRQTPLGLVG